jgi:hypothetical protein
MTPREDGIGWGGNRLAAPDRIRPGSRVSVAPPPAATATPWAVWRGMIPQPAPATKARNHPVCNAADAVRDGGESTRIAATAPRIDAKRTP